MLLDAEIVSATERILSLETDLGNMQTENKFLIGCNFALETETRHATENSMSSKAELEHLQSENKRLTELIVALEMDASTSRAAARRRAVNAAHMAAQYTEIRMKKEASKVTGVRTSIS